MSGREFPDVVSFSIARRGMGGGPDHQRCARAADPPHNYCAQTHTHTHATGRTPIDKTLN